MTVSTNDRQVIENVFRAMQTGPTAEKELLELFAEDGILVEPFTGQMQTHEGKPAIKASLVPMWANRAPDMKIMLDRVDLQGTTVRAEWTCTSSAMPGPMRGYDLFQIKSGKINRMEIFVTEMPQFPGQ
ncbi:MAG: nuclear transport factor 2 family protein [Gemmatales bacterium]